MKRNVFLIISAVLAMFFGLHMLIAPGKMLANMVTVSSSDLEHALQWSGTMLVSIAIINFLSRNDAGSAALRAVMIGNIILHVVGFAVDAYDYSIDFIKMPGLISGTIVHGLLTIGFIYYLMKLPKAAA
jgi:hypothetical protein